MKLIDALELIKAPSASAVSKRFLLACGFTPLHLLTFLKAHLRQRLPDVAADWKTGLYGDLAGTMERHCAAPEALDSAVAIVEWPDLDPRLGIRQLGGWAPELLPDILASVAAMQSRLETAIGRMAESCPVVVCLPTLPLPPIAHTAGWQAASFELRLREAVLSFAARLAESPRVRIVNPQRLDAISPPALRHDASSELAAGFPYRTAHAEAVARLLAAAVENAPPKKGLITDLDDTFWKGILGEVGVDGVCWDLATHAQAHGLYQQFLDALTRRGVLIAVASKNDPALVADALRRPGLRIPPDRLYPVQAHWRRKSESVSAILQTWNIAADSVVFVDDSAMELAEVRMAHPGIHCALFPRDNPAAVLEMLETLRDAFGKDVLSGEDRIRGESIRGAAAWQEVSREDGASLDAFLQSAQASVRFAWRAGDGARRAFELVNKTNQFNLNGRRYRESDWQRCLQRDGAFLLTVAYEDKFGPLGEIAALLGRADRQGAVFVDAWVMSCRAFSRRIEFQSLRCLFARYRAGQVVLDWVETPRNAPMREFLSLFGAPEPQFRIARSAFEAACPALFHSVQEVE